MKKLLPIIALGGLLTACGTADEAANNKEVNTGAATEDKQGEALEMLQLEGYVTKVEEPGRYVIAHHESRNVSPGNEQYVDLLIVHSEEQLEVGDYVKVWYDIVLTSYPGQTTAKKLEVIEPTAKSTLAAKQIVTAVAQQFEHFPIITNVAYDEVKKRWTLQYKDLNALSNDALISMAIEDKEPMTLGTPIYDTPPTLQLKLNDTDIIDFYLQSYDWTYMDLATDSEKTVQETVEEVTFPSMSEGYTVQKPESFMFQSNLPVKEVEMVFLDEQQNVIAKVTDAKDIPAGVHHIQVNVTFEQGTAMYVHTIGFE